MKRNAKYTAQGAMIAAIYAAATIGLSFMSYGQFQLRPAEALIVTACFTPAAIPGLAIGCMIGNIMSPFGLADVLIGGVVTLISAFWSYLLRNIRIKSMPLISPLGTVILNAVYVGLLTYFTGTADLFLPSVLWTLLSEILVCYLLGMPLYFIIKKYSK